MRIPCNLGTYSATIQGGFAVILIHKFLLLFITFYAEELENILVLTLL